MNYYTSLQLHLREHSTRGELLGVLAPATAGRLWSKAGHDPSLEIVSRLHDGGVSVPSGYPLSHAEVVKRIENFTSPQIAKAGNGRFSKDTVDSVRQGRRSPRWSTVVAITDAVDSLSTECN